MGKRGNGANCVEAGGAAATAAQDFLAKAKARAALCKTVKSPTTPVPATPKTTASKPKNPVPSTPQKTSPLGAVQEKKMPKKSLDEAHAKAASATPNPKGSTGPQTMPTPSSVKSCLCLILRMLSMTPDPMQCIIIILQYTSSTDVYFHIQGHRSKAPTTSSAEFLANSQLRHPSNSAWVCRLRVRDSVQLQG